MQDGVSTLSADSGNVHDYIESSDAKHYIPKSKSMPNYGDLQTVEPYAIQSKHPLDNFFELLIKILQLHCFDSYNGDLFFALTMMTKQKCVSFQAIPLVCSAKNRCLVKQAVCVKL
jgi:hypothetical protein